VVTDDDGLDLAEALAQRAIRDAVAQAATLPPMFAASREPWQVFDDGVGVTARSPAAAANDTRRHRLQQTHPHLSAWEQAADMPIISPAQGTQAVQQGASTAAVMKWACASIWRVQIEARLQCLANDRDGRPLLSSFMPLAALVANIRGFGLGDSGAELERALDKLRAVADLVCFNGYLVMALQPSVSATSHGEELRLPEHTL
jgi:hypothetical protein